MATERPIPPEEYEVIVRHVPIVSVDLIVHHRGGIVLGKRKNAPAEGEWFVPGGTVLKGETRRQAAHRIATEELGIEVRIDRELGVYEHAYPTAEVPGEHSKEYLATAYVVTPVTDELRPDDQHSRLGVFTAPFPPLHDYVQRYVHDLRCAGYSYVPVDTTHNSDRSGESPDIVFQNDAEEGR